MMRRMRSKPVTWTRLRAHHYWSRSDEERRVKAELWSEAGSPVSDPAAPVTGASTGHPGLALDAEGTDRAHSVPDDTLVRYGPAVREALRRAVASRSEDYLAACTIYRDAAEYLPEWIEFHRLMGVERFFLYDNGSADDHERCSPPTSPRAS